MAGARFRIRRRSFGKFRRRKSSYELAQLSICRAGMDLGLSSCEVPDQFYHCLVNTRDWVRPMVLGSGLPNDVNVVPAHSGRDIVVRGIQFDYYYSFVPSDSVSAEEAGAVGITSIRTALVKMKLAPGGSAGEFSRPQPTGFPPNLLFHQETMLRQPEQNAGSATNFEEAQRYRMLWRGMDMMQNVVLPPASLPPTASAATATANVAAHCTPRYHLGSRHVKVMTSVRLAHDEGLFVFTEVVNPFLTDNPTIALDLFGSLVVRQTFRGNRYEV